VQVEQVDFVAVPTRDLGRAVAWYRDVLGLAASEHAEGEVETPNLTLSFWNPEADGEEFVPMTAGIGLRVADVHAALEEMRAAGAEIIGVEDTGVCLMGFVKDPDGNTVILHRRYTSRG
jgi:catechol 2,3-dioxygenase-like lactoylglutathione lyase family enzyme